MMTELKNVTDQHVPTQQDPINLGSAYTQGKHPEKMNGHTRRHVKPTQSVTGPDSDVFITRPQEYAII